MTLVDLLPSIVSEWKHSPRQFLISRLLGLVFLTGISPLIGIWMVLEGELRSNPVDQWLMSHAGVRLITEISISVMLLVGVAINFQLKRRAQVRWLALGFGLSLAWCSFVGWWALVATRL